MKIVLGFLFAMVLCGCATHKTICVDRDKDGICRAEQIQYIQRSKK